MADIELVIKISEEDFEIMKHNIAVDNPLCPLSQEKMVAIVAHGTPLPKGHGRLIDIDDIRVIELEDSLHIMRHEKGDEIDVYIDAPTIIEADKDESGDISGGIS